MGTVDGGEEGRPGTTAVAGAEGDDAVPTATVVEGDVVGTDGQGVGAQTGTGDSAGTDESSEALARGSGTGTDNSATLAAVSRPAG